MPDGRDENSFFEKDCQYVVVEVFRTRSDLGKASVHRPVARKVGVVDNDALIRESSKLQGLIRERRPIDNIKSTGVGVRKTMRRTKLYELLRHRQATSKRPRNRNTLYQVA